MLPEMRQTGDPEAVLMKRASQLGWAPAILERAAQLFNQVKTLNVQRKAASAEERGKTFALVDVPDLLAKYSSTHPVQAPVSPLSGWWFDEPGEKSAATKQAVYLDRAPDLLGQASGLPMPTVDVTADTRTKQASAEPPQWQKQAAKRAEFKLLDADIRSLNVAVAEDTGIMLNGFAKLASIAWDSGQVATEIAQDMRMLTGCDATFLEKFATLCRSKNLKVDLEAPDSRILGTDRHGIETIAKQAHTAYQSSMGLLELQQELRDKQAAIDLDDFADVEPGLDQETIDRIAGDTPVFDAVTGGAGTTGGGGGDPFVRPRRSDAEEREVQDEEEADTTSSDRKKSPSSTSTPTTTGKTPAEGGNVAGAVNSMFGAVNKGRDTYVKGLLSSTADRYRRQHGLEKKVGDDLKSRLILARLLLNDPILSKADPQMAASLFSSIRRANPAIASDPNLLAGALREAMAQDGILLHHYKQMLDTRPQAQEEAKKKERSPFVVNVMA